MNSVNDKQRKALGKGLSALLPTRPAAAPPLPSTPASTPTSTPASTLGTTAAAAPAPAPEARPRTLPIDAIRPNPMQPRTVFQPDRLEELAASIRAHGIIQPLIVRETGDGHQII